MFTSSSDSCVSSSSQPPHSMHHPRGDDEETTSAVHVGTEAFASAPWVQQPQQGGWPQGQADSWPTRGGAEAVLDVDASLLQTSQRAFQQLLLLLQPHLTAGCPAVGTCSSLCSNDGSSAVFVQPALCEAPPGMGGEMCMPLVQLAGSVPKRRRI